MANDEEAIMIACASLVFCALGIHAKNMKKAKTCNVGTRLLDKSLRHTWTQQDMLSYQTYHTPSLGGR